jgi:hypothetical protein
LDYIVNKYRSVCGLYLLIGVGKHQEVAKYKSGDFHKHADGIVLLLNNVNIEGVVIPCFTFSSLY